MSPEPTASLDARFSDAGVEPTRWRDAERVLEGAELAFAKDPHAHTTYRFGDR